MESEIAQDTPQQQCAPFDRLVAKPSPASVRIELLTAHNAMFRSAVRTWPA
jgi:hypothetical protein